MNKNDKKQSMDWKEYQALKEKAAQKKPVTIPKPVQFLLFSPIILMCLFGIFYIPFLAIQSATSAKTATVDHKADTK